MNKIFIFIFSYLTILYSEDTFLWDLGIIIKSKDTSALVKNTDTIKPLISNTQIAPSYKKHTGINLFEKINLSIEPKHLIKLLYLNNEYFQLTEYIQSLQNIKIPINLNDEQRLIYADALYQIGNYKDAINNVNLLSEDYPTDEKYFLLALYNKKSGNPKKAIVLLNSLIYEYPSSDYIKLAKLQTRELK